MSDTQTLLDQFVFGKVIGTLNGQFNFGLLTPTMVENATAPFEIANGLGEGCVGDHREVTNKSRVMAWNFVYPLDPATNKPRHEFPLARRWAPVDGKFPPGLVYAKLIACGMQAGENASDALTAITNLVAGPLFHGAYSAYRDQRPFWNVAGGTEMIFRLGELTDWYVDDSAGKVKFPMEFESGDHRVRSNLLRIREEGYVAYDPAWRFNPKVGSKILAWGPVSDVGTTLRMQNWCPIAFSEEVSLSLARIIATYKTIGPEKASELLTNAAMICAEELLRGKNVFAVRKGGARGNGNLQTAPMNASAETPAAEIAAEVGDLGAGQLVGQKVTTTLVELPESAAPTAAPTDEPEQALKVATEEAVNALGARGLEVLAAYFENTPVPEAFAQVVVKAFGQALLAGDDENYATRVAITALETAGVKWDPKKKAWKFSAAAKKAVAETEKVKA